MFNSPNSGVPAVVPEMPLRDTQSVNSDTDKTITNPGVFVTSTRQKLQQSLSLVSFVDGFRNKPSFGLHAWNHLLLTLDGRDKFTKLLQYSCRLLAWWLQQSITIKETKSNTGSSGSGIRNKLSAFFIAERFAAMKSSLATSRKAFRLGRSMVEIQKLQSLGVLQWFDRYLKRCSDGDTSNNPNATATTLIQALREIAYCFCRPSAMHLTSKPQTDVVQTPLWNIAGNSIKSIGLLFFWAADNMSFLLQSGFLDDYQQNSDDRLNKRSNQIEKATSIANQSYFIAAIAGLTTNWISYWNYTKNHISKLKQDVIFSESNATTQSEAERALQKGQEKQFALFVALTKSLCDVLVFSNNTGIDLWRSFRGRPLNEGLHCLCGIVSASVVLYNNYPIMSDME